MIKKYFNKFYFFLFYKLNFLLKEKKILRKIKEVSFSLDIRDPLEREILMTNNYEEVQLDCLIDHIKSNPVEYFIDVGANIGYYSLIVSKNFPNIKIISFEPIKKTFFKLEKNIKINNFKNISAYNFGLSDKNIQLNVRSMIKKKFIQSGGSTVHNTARQLKNNEVLEKCDFKVGDDILNLKNKSICIKIDVEEHEKEVLIGLNKILNQNKVFIQIEAFHENQKECINFLEKNNLIFIRKISGKRKNDFHFSN